MAVYGANGNRLTKTQFLAKLTSQAGPTTFTATEDMTGDFPYTGEEGKRPNTGRKSAVYSGQKLTQEQVDKMYPSASISSITPNSGPIAGGTPVTIKGKLLDGTTGVTIGGTGITSFVAVDDETITGVTPSGTAGAKNVIAADDSGNVTMTNGYTFV